MNGFRGANLARRKYLKKEEIEFVVDTLESLYPDAKAELNYTTPFELLIATILSAQCTDVRVNIVTEKLFQLVKTPQDVNEMSMEQLMTLIKTCGLYKSKAKNIKATCEVLHRDYGGQIPTDRDELTKLAGVGRKTANVVVSNAFGIPAIAVDTHVFRVSNRLGLAYADNVLETEKQLMKRIPKNRWTKMHHAIIFHGRRQCKARKPLCDECKLSEVCLYFLYNMSPA